MKLWILLMIGYGIYLAFFRKSPEVLEDSNETKKDTMLATYSPREGNGVVHVQQEETNRLRMLLESNPSKEDRERYIAEFKEIFGKDFLDKNTEEIPFTEV